MRISLIRESVSVIWASINMYESLKKKKKNIYDFIICMIKYSWPHVETAGNVAPLQ